MRRSRIHNRSAVTKTQTERNGQRLRISIRDMEYVGFRGRLRINGVLQNGGSMWSILFWVLVATIRSDQTRPTQSVTQRPYITSQQARLLQKGLGSGLCFIHSLYIKCFAIHLHYQQLAILLSVTKSDPNNNQMLKVPFTVVRGKIVTLDKNWRVQAPLFQDGHCPLT